MCWWINYILLDNLCEMILSVFRLGHASPVKVQLYTDIWLELHVIQNEIVNFLIYS